MDFLKDLLKHLNNNYYDPLNRWVYNAKDKELNEALKVITSAEGLKICNARRLKKYEIFIKMLVKGQLVRPPKSSPAVNPSKVKKHAHSCNILVSSLARVLKRLTYQRTFRLFSVSFVVSLNDPKECKGKVFTFRRKLKRTFEILENKKAGLAKTIFSNFSIKKRTVKLKNRSSEKFIRKLAKYSLWNAVKKGRVINEQLGFWKWKICLDKNTRKIERFFKAFWSRQSRIFNLTRMIVINFSTRANMLAKKNVDFWRRVVFEYKFNDFRELEIEKNLNNFEGLFSFKVFNQLNENFQIIKEKSKKMRTRKEKMLHKKSHLLLLSNLLSEKIRKALKTWKRSLFRKRKPELIDTIYCSAVEKPVILIEISRKISRELRLTLQNLKKVFHKKIKQVWNVWAFRKADLKNTSFLSNDTTMDLSNFILPQDKRTKLRMIIKILINILYSRKNLSHLSLHLWRASFFDRERAKVNIQQIIQRQQLKLKAKIMVFTSLKLACTYPLTFTDID